MTNNQPKGRKVFGDGERNAGKHFLTTHGATIWHRESGYTIYLLRNGEMWHEFDGIHEITGEEQPSYFLRPYSENQTE